MSADVARRLYLDLMIRTLTDLVHDETGTISLNGTVFRSDLREDGCDWPVRAHTMIGVKRLENILACADAVLTDGVPGDFMETGVWRGGATIFMRAILQAYADRDRSVWVADSFAGLPEPDAAAYPSDANDLLYTYASLAVPLAEVRDNFARYGLLDDRVRFVEGWFRDTLPKCEVKRLALLRLDGDMYESTIVALDALYPKLSIGGFVIVDDYGAIEACRQAVDDYRKRHDVRDELHAVDWTGRYWRRTR